MRKCLSMLLALLLVLPGITLAQDSNSFTFSDIGATLELPSGVYAQVLTPGNLEANQAYLQTLGTTLEEAKARYQQDGVLMRAYDEKDGRVLTLTALKDSEAEQYFNINEHTPETRASYRRMHAIGEKYISQGYNYNSVEWKNFRGVGRWLMLKYDLRQGGEVAGRGYQRRTVYNGYTITLDLYVPGGRQLKGADNTALNKVFNTLAFTNTLPLPELPVLFNEKVSAPMETSEPTFTMTGTTLGNARLVAVVGSYSTAKTQVVEATAKKNGEYSLTITLPAEDLYFLTLTVQADGALPLEKQYAITYRKGLMSVSMSSVPPEILTDDSYRIAGTAEKGAQVQLSVNNKSTTKKVGANGTFTFTADTSQEGEYEFRLIFSKQGFENRIFTYNGSRTLSEEERVARIKDAAQSPKYNTLRNNIDRYDGDMLSYTGYLVSSEEKAGEWVMTFALEKDGETYSDYLILASEKEPGFPLNTPVLVYGVLVGTNSMMNDEKQEIEIPKLQVKLVEGTTL